MSEAQSEDHQQPARPGITRRRVLAATAAAAPILILATPAPAFALTACGNVAFPGAWTMAITPPGSTLSGGGQTGFNGSVFWSEKDPLVSTATITFTSGPITVVPGVNYTFNFTADYNFGSNNMGTSLGQQFTLTVGGQTLTRATRATMGTLIGPTVNVQYPMSVGFTAASTTVTAKFVFTFQWGSPSGGWDDIRLRNPMLRC